ncbi:hypothetical protein ACFV0L_19860 [Streptosporangium canum]|uniref:hypothetical protein n=1 Tax=Streptosporangium canum TaxID=324952 RepID=UPI00368AF626
MKFVVHRTVVPRSRARPRGRGRSGDRDGGHATGRAPRPSRPRSGGAGPPVVDGTTVLGDVDPTLVPRERPDRDRRERSA